MKNLSQIIVFGLFALSYPQNVVQKKVCILSIRASGGHDATAKALKNSLIKNGCECDILYLDDYDFLKFGKIYDTCMRSRIGRYAIKYFITKFYWRNASTLMSLYSRYFKSDVVKIMQYNQYDCLVSVVPFTYNLMNDMSSLIDYNIPKVIIPTDIWNPAPGYWIGGDDALYLLGSQELDLLAMNKNIKDKYLLSGMIIKEEFIEDIASKQERKDELGLDDKTTVLVMFGACGSDEMINIMKNLQNAKDDYNVVFICGKNETLKKQLEQLKKKYNLSNFIVKGYTTDVHKWMQASDVFIGKAGPGCLSECIASRLPIIFINKEILVQEEYNAQFITNNQIGIGVNSASQTLTAVKKIISTNEYYSSINKLPRNFAIYEATEKIMYYLD